MSNKEVLSKSYQKFCSAEGNQHIASEYAIKKLQQIIEQFQVKNILEVGLGIGSIAGSLLKLNRDIKYTGTEADQFCLEALPGNLQKDYGRLQIFSGLENLPENSKYDLVIIDGTDPGLEKIRDLIRKSGVIAIEGDRQPQLKLLKELFPGNRAVHAISLSKNRSYSPFPAGEWQGGLKIIFVDPNRKQFVWWLKEKLCTKMKYQVPGRHFGSTKNRKKRFRGGE